MKILQWLGIFALVLASYALFGVVFADLWRMVFVPAGLPAITAQQAAIGWLMAGLLVMPQHTDKEPKDFALAAVTKMFVVLLTWGVAYLMAAVLP